MKKPIFHFEDESYKAFEDYLYNCMPHDKCKDIYIMINCIEDLYDYIQINGIVQKTCSTETTAYTIVRNITYWYIDWVDEIRDFLYEYCDVVMDVWEEDARYEKILKTLKMYTARKRVVELGGNKMTVKDFMEKNKDEIKKEVKDIWDQLDMPLDNSDVEPWTRKSSDIKEEEESPSSPEPITNVKDVTRESLLDGAYKCICCDRNKQYGSPEDNFGIIARYWKEYLGVDITAMDVGVMMTLFKIGRMQSGGYKPDNFVDAIGYLACAGECGSKFNIDDED